MSFIKDVYHYFSPKWQNAFWDYPVDLQPVYGSSGRPEHHPLLYRTLSRKNAQYLTLLENFLTYKKEILLIPLHSKKGQTIKPSWINGYFSGLDTYALYGLIRKLQPKQYFEIGSGFSTKVAHMAKLDGALDMKIISLDPCPRSTIQPIVDELIPKSLESAQGAKDIPDRLQQGDILFIDSSHRLFANSDCMHLYLNIIPHLKKGVYIHIHDIYLPYDYPQFMCDRYYNENYALAIFLIANPDYFDVVLPNYYISKNEVFQDSINALFASPGMDSIEKHGGSIWLMKK